jgi:putative FmdB family regulatory protein
MPLINYFCLDCKARFSSIYRKASDVVSKVDCKKCGGSNAVRQLSAPSSVSKIVVDNGIQAKAVEIIPEVIESNKEMSKKGYNRGD